MIALHWHYFYFFFSLTKFNAKVYCRNTSLIRRTKRFTLYNSSYWSTSNTQLDGVRQQKRKRERKRQMYDDRMGENECKIWMRKSRGAKEVCHLSDLCVCGLLSLIYCCYINLFFRSLSLSPSVSVQLLLHFVSVLFLFLIYSDVIISFRRSHLICAYYAFWLNDFTNIVYDSKTCFWAKHAYIDNEK